MSPPLATRVTASPATSRANAATCRTSAPGWIPGPWCSATCLSHVSSEKPTSERASASHAPRLSGALGRAAAMLATTRPTSPCRAICGSRLPPSCSATRSTWMTTWSGPKRGGLPYSRLALKALPRTMTRSAAMRAAPAWRSEPRHHGCESGISPRAALVVATGSCATSQSRAISSPAPDQKAPLPARTIGRDARSIASTALATSSGAAGGGAAEGKGEPAGVRCRDDARGEDVVRHLEVYRPRSARAGAVDRFLGGTSDHLASVARCCPLRDRRDHGPLLDIHDGPAPGQAKSGATGDEHQRDVPHARVDEARERVGEPGPSGHRRDACQSGGESPTFSGEGCGALVAHADDPDAGVDAAVEKLDNVAAAEGEKRVDTLTAQRVGHQPAAVRFPSRGFVR